jgi:hypothetical protein
MSSTTTRSRDVIATVTRYRTRSRTRTELTRGERYVIIALAMILAQLVLRGWAASGSWFYSDDFIFLGATAHGDADTAWLFHAHNVHLMPLGLWLSTLVGHTGAFSWWFAATQIIVMQALASLACWWMLRRLFGDRPGVLVALGFYLFSPLSFPTVVWWSAALNQLPHQIALFGAVATHVGYLRTRHPSQAVLAGLFLLIGLASYAKAALIPFVLVVLAVLYFSSGRPVERLRTALVRYWHAWAIYGVLLVGYLVLYFVKVPTTERPSVSGTLDTLDLTITQAFGPAALGGPWSWQSLDLLGGVGPRLFVDTPLFLVAVAWVVVAAFWAHQPLVRRRAWWPLLLLAPYLVLGALLIAVGRAEAFGATSAGLELRYLADMGGVVALSLALATMPVKGAWQSSELRTSPLIAVGPPRRLLQVGAVVFLVGSLVSSIAYARPWHDDARMPQRTYVDTVRSQLGSTPVTVAETGLPDDVMSAVTFPYNLVSRFLAPFGDRIRVAAAGNDLSVFDDRGRIAEAVVAGDRPRSQPGPVDGCGYLVNQQQVDPIAIDPVFNFRFWMSINYLAGAEGDITIRAGANIIEAHVESGPHILFVQTAGAYDEVSIEPADPALGVCVDSINVGQLIPKEPR